jgi:uncharacterized protein
MRLDLGPLERLPAERAFAFEETFEPMTVGGEPVAFDGPVEVSGKAERVRGGVLLSGEVRAPVRLRCGRCLDLFPTLLRPELDLMLAPPGAEGAEDSLPYAETLDLTPAVEEAIVLDLPVRPLCRPDCPGLCPRCGARRDAGCSCPPEPDGDGRWSALADWLRSHPDSPEDGESRA